MKLLQELSATWLDVFALVFFIAAWMGYAVFAERHGRAVPSLHNQMDTFRREWMLRMIERDNRMLDANILRILARSSQFFASTTMLVLGALIALTGYVQQALDVVSGLPFTMRSSARLLEVKILRGSSACSTIASSSRKRCRRCWRKTARLRCGRDRS